MIRRQGGMRQAGCALNVMHCGAAQAYRLRRCPHDSRNTAIPLRKIVMKKLILSVVATLSLAACATTEGLTNAEELALYRTHAGEPVQAFQYTGHLNGWVPIGDTALAVWTRLSEAYLLELSGPCMDLDYAPAISLSNMMSRVSARFDNVYVLGGGNSSMRLPCRIETIRPLDVKALKQAQKDLREAKVVEREAANG